MHVMEGYCAEKRSEYVGEWTSNAEEANEICVFAVGVFEEITFGGHLY